MQMVVRQLVGDDLVIKTVALNNFCIQHSNQPEPTVSELFK